MASTGASIAALMFGPDAGPGTPAPEPARLPAAPLVEGDVVRLLRTRYAPYFLAGAVGQIIEAKEHGGGYWYNVRCRRDHLWIDGADLAFIRHALPDGADTKGVTMQKERDTVQQAEPSAWELYVPARQIGLELLSDGWLVLSSAAVAVLGEKVELLWHAERRAMGLRKAARPDGESALPVIVRQRRRMIDLAEFLNSRGVQPTLAKGEYAAVEQVGMFVVQLRGAAIPPGD